MTRRTHSRTALVAAALLAAAGGLALIGVGWWLRHWRYRDDWDRLTDGDWWFGWVISGLGHLTFGKAGFVAALAVVGGVTALVGRVRGQREPDGWETAGANTPAPEAGSGAAGSDAGRSESGPSGAA